MTIASLAFGEFGAILERLAHPIATWKEKATHVSAGRKLMVRSEDRANESRRIDVKRIRAAIAFMPRISFNLERLRATAIRGGG